MDSGVELPGLVMSQPQRQSRRTSRSPPPVYMALPQSGEVRIPAGVHIAEPPRYLPPVTSRFHERLSDIQTRRNLDETQFNGNLWPRRVNHRAGRNRRDPDRTGVIKEKFCCVYLWVGVAAMATIVVIVVHFARKANGREVADQPAQTCHFDLGHAIRCDSTGAGRFGCGSIALNCGMDKCSGNKWVLGENIRGGKFACKVHAAKRYCQEARCDDESCKNFRPECVDENISPEGRIMMWDSSDSFLGV